MAKETPGQKKTVERVMHEFKHGELETRGGRKVTSQRQAVAIALHEAGATNQEEVATNKRNYARTKRKEAAGETARDEKEGRTKDLSRADLYAEARRKDVPGRSKMSKAELARAVGR